MSRVCNVKGFWVYNATKKQHWDVFMMTDFEGDERKKKAKCEEASF